MNRSAAFALAAARHAPGPSRRLPSAAPYAKVGFVFSESEKKKLDDLKTSIAQAGKTGKYVAAGLGAVAVGLLALSMRARAERQRDVRATRAQYLDDWISEPTVVTAERRRKKAA